jgi:Zn-dependent protease with chaperone function
VDLKTLSDSDIQRYRHPSERQSLTVIFTIILGVALGLALVGSSTREWLREQFNWAPRGLVGLVLELLHGDRFIVLLLTFLIVVALLEIIGQWLDRAHVLAGSVEITASTYPEHFKILEELRGRFSLPSVRVFVQRSAGLTPRSFGIHSPYFVIFPSTAFGGLSMAEFKFLLGHELGHIKLGHTLMTPFVGGGHISSAGKDILRKVRNNIFASFTRSQELSADRIGALGSRSVQPAIDRLIRFNLAPPRGTSIDVNTLTPHAEELSKGLVGAAAMFRQASSSDPDMLFRIQALTQWAGLPPPKPPPAPAAETPATPNATAQMPAVQAATAQPVATASSGTASPEVGVTPPLATAAATDQPAGRTASETPPPARSGTTSPTTTESGSS